MSSMRWIDGKWTEVPPEQCPAGHRLQPGNVLVGWLPCGCVTEMGHRTYFCRTCAGVVFEPDHTDHRMTATTWKGPDPYASTE